MSLRSPMAATAALIPSRDQIVIALLSVGRAEILRHWSINSCVASTRIAIDVLARYGYRA